MTDQTSLAVTLTNAKTQDASLYQGQNPALNTLALRIGGPPMQFVAGEDATATTIRINWAGLLTPDELKGVKVAGDGWDSNLVPARRGQILELRPTKDMSLPANTPQILTITVPRVSSEPIGDTISIAYRNIAGIDDDFVNLQMFVIAPPPAAANPVLLPVSIGWATDALPVVYVSSAKDKLIPNRLRFYLGNDSAKALGAVGGTAEFRISFMTVPEPDPTDPRPNPGRNALTYDTYARANIVMTPAGDGVTGWTIVPPANGKPLVWTLKPQNKDILDANASVEILIDGIRTVLPPFSTTLFVQSIVDIPGYTGRVQGLHFDKALPQPGILMFDADRREITAGEAVELTWQVMALDDLELSYLQNKRRIVKSYRNHDFALNDSMKVTPEAMTTYTLTPYARGMKLPAVGIAISVAQPKPKINSFVADPPGPLLVGHDGNPVTITLKWDVSGAYTLELWGPDSEEQVTGTTRIVKTIDRTSSFTLKATNREGDFDEKPVTVRILPPTIQKFEAVPPLCDFDPSKPFPNVTFNWAASGAKDFVLDGEVLDARSRARTKPVPLPSQIILTARNNDGTTTKGVWVKTYRDYLLDRTFDLNNTLLTSARFLHEQISFFHEPERNLDRCFWSFRTHTTLEDSGFGGRWQLDKTDRGFVLTIRMDLDPNMVVKLEYDRSLSPTGLKITQLPSAANWRGSRQIHDVLTYQRRNLIFLSSTA